MSIDGCLHSLFWASKVAADVLTQEYGRYFGMRTGTFRGGCLTGPHHARDVVAILEATQTAFTSGQTISVNKSA